MNLRKSLCLIILALGSAHAIAQDADAKTVIANASKAMGLDGVTSLYYYGSGATYNVGQNNNANIPWPQTPLNEYVRAIDFSVPASRATWSTFATPVTGGAPALANGQQNITPTSPGGWAQPARDLDHALGIPQGCRCQQCHRAASQQRSAHYEIAHVECADQVARWAVLSRGGLHQRRPPGREGADLAREPGAGRHAGRD